MVLQLGTFEVSIILAAQVAFTWWLKSAIKHEYEKNLNFLRVIGCVRRKRP